DRVLVARPTLREVDQVLLDVEHGGERLGRSAVDPQQVSSRRAGVGALELGRQPDEGVALHGGILPRNWMRARILAGWSRARAPARCSRGLAPGRGCTSR